MTYQIEQVGTNQAQRPVPVAGSPETEQGAATSVKASTSSGRVIQLDFVRGIAILGVMKFHFLTVPVTNPLGRFIDFLSKRLGWMGVDLFFVLSGFLVGGLLVQELLKTGHLRVGRFLFRRIFKIWPAYYVYILFQLVARKHPLPTFAWQNILNIQNYAGTSLNHTWSLAVEEHFYVFLPLLLLFIYKRDGLRKRLLPILAGLCVLVLAGRIVQVYGFHSHDPQWYTHSRIDGLLFGVILSYILYSRRTLFERISTARIPLCLMVLPGPLLGLYGGHATRIMWSVGYTLTYLSLGAVLLLLYGYHGTLIESRVYKAIAWVGVYSYGIYLWHLSVREPLAKLVTHVNPNVQWLSLLLLQYAAAILLGVLMTKAIEFPFLRLRDRYMPRGAAQLPPKVA
jgi:peptidoglycan/LPS O-acetylase OafA/YrhL